MRNFNVDFSKIFWGLCPPDPHIGDASRLRASRRVPPYKNPGYAPDDDKLLRQQKQLLLLLRLVLQSVACAIAVKRSRSGELDQFTGNA